jgi:hypothetical protein
MTAMGAITIAAATATIPATVVSTTACTILGGAEPPHWASNGSTFNVTRIP